MQWRPARQSGWSPSLVPPRVILSVWISTITNTHCGCALFVFPSLTASWYPICRMYVMVHGFLSLSTIRCAVALSSQHYTFLSALALCRLNSSVENSALFVWLSMSCIYSASCLGCVVNSTFLDTLLPLKWFSEACCHTFPPCPIHPLPSRK